MGHTQPLGMRSLDGLFALDFVLPAQFFGKRQGEQERNGERELASAVVLDAIAAAWRGEEDAREWLTSPSLDRLYSCAYLCGVLGIDHAALVAALPRLYALPQSPCGGRHHKRVRVRTITTMNRTYVRKGRKRWDGRGK